MTPIPYSLTHRAYEELARRDVEDVDCPIPYALTQRAYEELAREERDNATEEP